MGKHVLVIDDCKLTLNIANQILVNAGYEVSTAEDVVYCNDIIYSKSPPDLILLDVNLPLMSGDHKARIIKNRPKSSHIPIILMSSMDNSELSLIADSCGADGFLVKPVDAELLLGTIEQLLGNQGACQNN